MKIDLSLGENLKKLRNKKGISQSEAAKALGVHLHSYYLWENGLGNPSEDNLKKIKSFFGKGL